MTRENLAHIVDDLFTGVAFAVMITCDLINDGGQFLVGRIAWLEGIILALIRKGVS